MLSVAFIVMLTGIMPKAVMLSVMAPIYTPTMKTQHNLEIESSAVMLNSVYAKCSIYCYADRHYAECRYAECHGAKLYPNNENILNC